MGRRPPRGLVLDAGALIAFDNHGRLVTVLVQRAKDLDASIVIPAGALAQAWRNGSQQARLAALLSSRNVTVEDLNGPQARAVGELCGRRRTADIVNASVVVAARKHGGIVATSDPHDLLHLDPMLTVVQV